MARAGEQAIGSRGAQGGIPRVGNDDIVKGRIGAPEARESDFDYHRVGGMAQWFATLVGSVLRLNEIACSQVPWSPSWIFLDTGEGLTAAANQRHTGFLGPA